MNIKLSAKLLSEKLKAISGFSDLKPMIIVF